MCPRADKIHKVLCPKRLANPLSPSKPSSYLTTGQVAKLCSVTPDTVLKWVQSGKLPASRTPGGHCRIHRVALFEFLSQRTRKESERPYQFCWEFNAKSGEIRSACRSCLVYRSRAARCYELAREVKNSGRVKLLCRTPCRECEFYQMLQQWRV